MINNITAAHLDYLQRANEELASLSSIRDKGALLRRLWHITEISSPKIQKHPNAKENTKEMQLPGEILLTSLYGNRIPVAFQVNNQPGNIEIQVGTWMSDSNQNNGLLSLDQRHLILKSAFDSLYAAIEMKSIEVSSKPYSHAGLALGIPTSSYPQSAEDPVPLDRLIRAIPGGHWSFLVLAEPVLESDISKFRQDIINEMFTVQVAAKSSQTTVQSLLEHYNNLLKISLETLTNGMTVGAWYTTVYLMGDEISYSSLSSLWRGVFSGDKSLPESIRVWNSTEAGRLAEKWTIPETRKMESPGSYKRPREFQTVLTSKQLAAYINLPQLEVGGFKVSTIPEFDVMPPDTNKDGNISIGSVMMRNKEINKNYLINKDDLMRHTFVTGVTGQGKTNTIFYLLKELSRQDIRFLVIEPAKTEYRSLINDPALKGELQVFTLGNEQFSPFRLNPFEVLPGTPVAVHLDLLRSVFAASFGMWTPLPQILERCLYEIYEDCGWDIAGDENIRLNGQKSFAGAFPTLSDLAAKVDSVTRQLGYEDRVASDLRAALLTRINSLRTGAKGLMLDVEESVPMEALLEKPTVLELEGVGDDDDKAFLMGLVLIRLVMYRRAGDQTKSLEHILVIEEAHRLLTNGSTQTKAEEGNPRGKAVETFANLLSEIRAYGQGIIISDQVPVKLAPDVIKNTNLKIIHRIVAADDRAVLAGATAMNEKQSTALTILNKGYAVVFSEGDDAPVHVKVEPAKPDEPIPKNKQVAEYMQMLLKDRPFLLPANTRCSQYCLHNHKLHSLARSIVDDEAFQRTFARIVLSVIHSINALERMWGDLVAHLQPKRPAWADDKELFECVWVHASWWFANKRGAQAAWKYTDTWQFAINLRDAYIQSMAEGNTRALTSFQVFARQQHLRLFDPYPACSLVCRQRPPLCLYRYAVEDLAESGRLTAAWKTALLDDRSSQSGNPINTWEVCMDAGIQLMEFARSDWPEMEKSENLAGARRASLCFAQHMLAIDPSIAPGEAGKTINKLLSTSENKL